MNLSTPNSTQRKKSSASKADSRDEISSNTSNAPEMPMPLKHEIEDLINKEKTLLQLQLLDQELEAELWKSKYDELKEKVIEDVMEEEEEVKLYETLANLEDQEINNYYIPTDPNYLLISHVEHMIGNFSYVNFTQEVFFRVMKELFSPRKSSSYLTDADGAPLEVNILWLDHCQLGPRFADTINNILKNPKLDAIDLSHNNINAEMAIPLISILANRRKTPQYLLLHGNMPYASQAKTFTDFFKVLSEDTWGFSISLQDYSNLRKETKEKESENTKRRGKKDETMSYRDHTKPPMKAHAFLKGLSDHLYKLKTSTGEEIIEKKKQRQQSLKNGQISNRSLFPFRYLMVLGITDCHLSRQSIDLLQDTYEYLRENLTELDLSYCYMGLYGLEMIESIIRDKHSQLISLNLKGNVLPDLAAIKISESMRKNVTLTNLNLSSNLISMTSVRQMMNILAKSLTLHRLDLRNNQPPFLAADVMEVQFKLQEHASLVHVILQDDYELMDSMPRHQQNAHLHLPPPPHPNPLLSQMMKIHPKFYCQPQLRKKYCSVGKAKRIMEIDFNALSLQYPRDYFMQPFILQWFFRPMPIVSFDQVQKTLVQNIHKRVDYTVKTVTRPSQSQSLNASTTGLTASTAIDTTLRDMNNTDRGSSGGKRVQKKILFEDPFLHINELFKICFEIRLLKQNRIIWSYDKPFHINNLQNRNFFTTSMDWYHYYEIIPKLFQDEHQLNTLHQHKLQIRLKCVPTDLYRREQYEFDSTMKALHFHLKQCFLTHFMIGSGNRYYYLGGDPKDTNDDADIILFHHHHHYSSVTRQRHQHLFNLERNLALQEAFERETRLVLFDDAQLWFHQHILLRCFEFHFAHITRRCKIRWSSKLYVKQFTDITSEGVEGGDEENFFSDNEDEDDSAEEELQDDKNKTLKKTTTSVKKESNKKSRQSRYYPFKLDYTELIEESDLPETFERENRSDNDHLLVGGVEEAEEEEETMAYEELLELDANKKRPKFFDFITYEWTVSVYEAISQKRRIIQTVCCDYQVEDLADLAEDQYEQRKRERDIQGIFEDDEDEDDEDEQDDEGEGGRAAMGQLLLPWMWESFEVEIDDLRPSDLVILSGRVLQRSLDEVTEEYSHRATNKAPPRKKDLSRLMKYLSVQVKEFESYLFIEEDLHEVSSQRASAMVPFIYPPSAIYGLPSYDLPYERFIRTNAILYEAEHDLHLPQYQQYFMSQPDQEEETVEEIDDAIHASSLKSTNSLLMRSRKVNTNMLRSRTTLNRKIAEMTQAEQTIPSFSQGEIERKASTSKSPSRRSQKNTNTMSSATMNEDERSNSRRGISIGSDSANAIVGERENITF